jgi:cytochrome c-type biogenesis protein CcmE
MKKTHLALLVVIAVLIGFIISIASDYSSYKTFATAMQNSERDFQIVGNLVKEQPMVYEPERDANAFTFYLKDKNGDIHKVVFNGGKPQDFERSEQIVLTGRMKGDDFYASKLLMKCPSKYKNSESETREFNANTQG